MKQVFIIFKKDLIDTLRDKRTMIVMILIPLLLFPMILLVTTKVQQSATKGEVTKKLKIGYVADAGESDFGLKTILVELGNMTVTDVADTVELRKLIRDGSLEAGIALESGFSSKVKELESAELRKFGPKSDNIVMGRIKAMTKIYQTQMLQTRLSSLHLEQENIEPIKISYSDTELDKETFGKIAGGFLPYIFIIFCYMGCMFPAIDLFTGEKERGSIETLLSAPVERWKILVGKMMVIVVAGLTTAILAILGLILSLKFIDGIPDELLSIAYEIISPQFIIVLLLMLIPLVTFFAGMMIPATVYAKSFKEASSIIQPLNFVVILPAMIGMMPGIKLTALTAAIPVLNVVLSTKELIAGTLNWGHFAIVMTTLLALAAIAVLISFNRFGNEKNILRN